MILSQNPTDNNPIELKGFFYKYVPYTLHLPNSKAAANLKIETTNIRLTSFDYYDSSNLNLRFNIQEHDFACLSVFDTIARKGVKLSIKAKDLPLKVNYFADNKEYSTGSTIYKSDIVVDGFFTCTVINFDADIRFKIKKFNLIFISDGEYHSYLSESSALTIEQKNALKKLKQKTIIVVDNIIVIGHNNEQIKAEPVVFYLN